jgi:hypothetical protein
MSDTEPTQPVPHTRGYAGVGPDSGTDRGAYCIECSRAVQDYVWPCAVAEPLPVPVDREGPS